MIKITKINNNLNASFEYDAATVEKIKTIPGRKYNSNNKSWDLPLYSIKKLMEVFGDELEISEDIDINYNKPKYDFKKELDTITTPELKVFAKWGLDMLPDYFYSVPASSTGKYHPSYAQGEEGLVRHVVAAVRIANELFNCHTMQNFTEEEQDIIRVSLLLHDGVKHGTDGGVYTTSTHPLEVVKYLDDKYYEVDEDSLPEEVIDIMEDGYLWEDISNCIKSHMGEWDNKGALPKPNSDMEKFVHICDYLASRKLLEVNFEVM